MNFTELFALDASTKVRKTREGYLVAKPRVARTGIQIYSGDEVGKPEMKSVAVYRPEAQVFSRDSLASFAHRPITDNHPREPLTAETWADHAVGQMGDEIVRDGEFVRVGTLIMDAAAIAAIEGGKAEMSVGYSCDLKWESGELPGGLKYDAIQENIRANHLAIVGAARGGHELRIGDSRMDKALRTIMIDGLSVETTDAGAQAIEKLQRDMAKIIADHSAALATRDGQIGTLTAAVASKDGEIAVLKKTVDENKITPALIDKHVADKLAVVTDAKRIMGADFKTDGKDAAAIKLEVVTAKLADAAKGFSVDAINGAFASLVANAPAAQGFVDMRNGIRQAAPSDSADKAWQDSVAAEANAWRTPKAQEQARQ